MKHLFLLALLVLLSMASARTRPGLRKVCAVRLKIDHNSVQTPFSSPVALRTPLTLYFRCRENGRAAPPASGKRPLVVVLPASLTPARDYSTMAIRLAQRRFVVAVPDYSRRRLFGVAPFFKSLQSVVKERRKSGLDCPKNGQLVTAELVNSVFKFFLAKEGRRRDVAQITDLTKTVLFGHAWGGTAAHIALSGACESVETPVVPPPADLSSNPELLLRSLCEQYSPLSSPEVKITGLIGFESVSDDTSRPVVSEDQFFVEIHSDSQKDRISSFFDGLPVSGRSARVQIGSANHYAPNNYEPAFSNQTPLCSRVRQPPEDTFTTTEDVQKRAIRSIVRVVDASYNIFVRSRRTRRLLRLMDQEDLLVEEVQLM